MRALVVLVLAVPAWGSVLLSTTAQTTAGLDASKSCFMTETVSANCSSRDGAVNGASADASASASLLNISLSVNTGAVFVASARATAEASYSEMVFILGGSGIGHLTIQYQIMVFGGFGSWTANVGGLGFYTGIEGYPVTSEFTYGVPFGLGGSASAYASAIRSDYGNIRVTVKPLWILADGSPATLQVIPEPGTWLLCVIALILGCTYHFRSMLVGTTDS
jgi:hypothetical protein